MLYNKGNPCLYKSILCQEGVCTGCMIFLEHCADADHENRGQNNSLYTKSKTPITRNVKIRKSELVALRK